MPVAMHAKVEIPVQTRQCENCTDQAILVIDGIAQRPQHAGERIRDGHPAIIAGLVLKAYKRCTAMGLMESRDDKKRVRLFDLNDFGLIGVSEQPVERKKK